jgi:hypothetical protein
MSQWWQAENQLENGGYDGGPLIMLARYSESAMPEDYIQDEWGEDEPVTFEFGLRVVPEVTRHGACKVFLGRQSESGHFIASPRFHQTRLLFCQSNK